MTRNPHPAAPPAPVQAEPCDDSCDCGFPCDGRDCAAARLAATGLCGGAAILLDCTGCAECECDCPIIGDRQIHGECPACAIVAELERSERAASAWEDAEDFRFRRW